MNLANLLWIYAQFDAVFGYHNYSDYSINPFFFSRKNCLYFYYNQIVIKTCILKYISNSFWRKKSMTRLCFFFNKLIPIDSEEPKIFILTLPCIIVMCEFHCSTNGKLPIYANTLFLVVLSKLKTRFGNLLNVFVCAPKMHIVH